MEEPTLPLITLEGIDKSGKATQARMLTKRLTKIGREVEVVAFPDYGTILGKVIKRYLSEKVDLCPEIRQLLYVANRWERQQDLKTWLSEGRIVVADRYIPSGLVYGLANGLNLDWMVSLEKGLPPSDIVIVVDVSVATAFKREEKKRDVYEKDREFLERVRKAYLELARRFGWIIVDGEKAKEEVAEEVWRHVLRIV